MKKKIMITLALALATAGSLAVAQPAAAVPGYERVVYYYSNASHTTMVGYRWTATCQPPYGLQPLHGTATPYTEIEVSPCD
jgi:hypothetical protein